MPAPRIGCSPGGWNPGWDDQPHRLGGNTFAATCADFDGDGFDDRAASTGNGSEDQTYLTLGGYSRYYLCDCWSIRPWVQADFGYALADFSGMYIGGSIGGTMFLDESSAIEARIYGETVSDDDDISGVGLEMG